MGQIARTHVCCRVAEGEFSVDALVEDKTQLIGGPATSRKPGNLMEILSAIVGNEAKKVFLRLYPPDHFYLLEVFLIVLKWLTSELYTHVS